MPSISYLLQETVRWAVLICFTVLLPLTVAAEEGAIGTNRQVRPLLSDKCFLCHGPDQGTRKKFRLDLAESALGRGHRAGPAGASELIKRIFNKDPKEVMPPARNTPEPHLSRKGIVANLDRTELI
jgi:hypothetical protein